MIFSNFSYCVTAWAHRLQLSTWHPYTASLKIMTQKPVWWHRSPFVCHIVRYKCQIQNIYLGEFLLVFKYINSFYIYRQDSDGVTPSMVIVKYHIVALK